MKKCLCILAVLLLLSSCALSEDMTYSVVSVTDCANSNRMYDRFYASAGFECIVPGLAQGFVPQGVTWLDAQKLFLYSGYREDGDRSPLLAVDPETGILVREVFLNNTDGTPYNGHAGGVCATETDIYVSNAHKLFRIPLSTFVDLPESSVCPFAEEIPVPVNSSFCSYENGILWVGEFQYGASYKTDRSHKTRTASGSYYAWICGYKLNEKPFSERMRGGVAVPDMILAVTERIQGMTTLNGTIWLSQSYGRGNSSLLYSYRNVLTQQPDTETDLNGVRVPVWYLDKNAQTDCIMAPPMSECLCTANGSVYVVFESASFPYMDPKNPSVNPIDRLVRLTIAD